jgi:hypothetical protein
MNSGIFEILGALAVRDPGAKLILFDSGLRAEARRFVIAANDEWTRLQPQSPSRPPGTHRAFVVDERQLTERELLPSQDVDRPLHTHGSLAILLPKNQGNLVNFRDGSIVVGFRAPDDGSNDENTFPIWMDTDLPDGRSFSYEQISTHLLSALCPETVKAGFEQELSDSVRRMAAGISYVADAYGTLGRTERASTGTQWLLHIDQSIRRFSRITLSKGSPTREWIKFCVDQYFFPALSLPNPRSGNHFEPSARTGVAKSVAQAIDRFWNESEGTNHVLDAISTIEDNRRREHPPRQALKISSLDWSKLRKTWTLDGRSSDFLAWHMHDDRNSASDTTDRCILFEDLTEEEFFGPLSSSSSRIDGVWGDGRPLRHDDLATEVVILSPVAFDSASRMLASPSLRLWIETVHGADPTSAQLGEIGIAPKRAKQSGGGLQFVVSSATFDDSTLKIVLDGYFRFEVAGRSSFSFRPEVVLLKVSGSIVRTGQEMRVLMLPSGGAGFLLGSGLKYLGPRKFDRLGRPLWDESDIDLDSGLVEMPIEKSAGESVSVVAWSSQVPNHVEMDGLSQQIWVDRGFLRWSKTFSARPSEQSIDLGWNYGGAHEND